MDAGWDGTRNGSSELPGARPNNDELSTEHTWNGFSESAGSRPNSVKSSTEHSTEHSRNGSSESSGANSNSVKSSTEHSTDYFHSTAQGCAVPVASDSTTFEAGASLSTTRIAIFKIENFYTNNLYDPVCGKTVKYVSNCGST